MELRKSNPVHKDLRTPKYRKRVEKKRKGKGSFKRVKHVSYE
jgi:stalled ribosome alternative rescue factor ArfA